jgi:hypothetical protein
MFMKRKIIVVIGIAVAIIVVLCTGVFGMTV